MKVGKTTRGFGRLEFEDHYGVECSLQVSSLAEVRAIWFGCNEPNAQIFPADGTGWHDYELPENVQCTTRMHLSQEQVIELLPYLQQFAETGELP